MFLGPRINKLMLISHLTFSVGWLGAVAVFIALGIAGLSSQNDQVIRSAYMAMVLSAKFIIIPFCLASLLTGIVQALGTKWGLFRYYWVIVKLFLTIVCTLLLVLHLKPISYLAGLAESAPFMLEGENQLRIQLIADAGLAILVLIGIITVSIYKPWGKIQRDMKSRDKLTGQPVKPKSKPSSFYVLISFVALIIIFIVMHLLGGGMGRH